MKELTSIYDDLEKRMAIFVGLGALLFTSLYLMTQGADLFSFLIRGTLALLVFTLAGWGWGHYLRRLLNQYAEEAPTGDIVRQARDAQTVKGQVVTPSDEVVIPAEEARGRAVDFHMPELQPTAAASAVPAEEDLGDLPPPPVPPGL